MWKNEKALRKNRKATPKKEWTLLTFVIEYLAENPKAPDGEVVAAWNKKRNEMVKAAQKLLKGVSTPL